MQQDSLDAHRDEVAGILKRQDEDGLPHISEAEMGRELGLEPTQVGSLLRRMEHDGVVSRTGGGNWELTPAAAMHTEARPHPREPRQAD
jgi:DNA-binding IclR family transcriptional regulator